MSRWLQGSMVAILALMAPLFSTEAAAGNGKASRGSTSAKSAEKSKRPLAAEKRQGKDALAPVTAKTKSASTKPSARAAPPHKQQTEVKRKDAGTARARGAKSLPPRRSDRRRPEPALTPPSVGRPAVRSVGSRLVIPSPEVAEQSLAYRYANLDDSAALAELDRRGIAWVRASPPLPGVRTPIRLGGPLHGVTIRSALPEPERRTTPFEILDARLALALDDFCALLARHDVVEVVHYTMYRPPGELPHDWNKQIRHPAGLAIDVGALRKADGRWLAVGPHWPSDIGAKTCGEGAREHWSRAGRELVSIACEAADLRVFHFILTPHFDAAHADHLHLEIKPDTRWFLVN
jgi:hypothetical protein